MIAKLRKRGALVSAPVKLPSHQAYVLRFGALIGLSFWGLFSQYVWAPEKLPLSFLVGGAIAEGLWLVHAKRPNFLINPETGARRIAPHLILAFAVFMGISQSLRIALKHLWPNCLSTQLGETVFSAFQMFPYCFYLAQLFAALKWPQAKKPSPASGNWDGPANLP